MESKIRPRDKKAVVIVFGDGFSVVSLHWAESRGFEVFPLIVDYGQASSEIEEACSVCKDFGETPQILKADLTEISVISVDVYVPARNLLILTLALAYAESIRAWDIFFAISKGDGSYPDVSQQFCKAFETTAQKCTLAGRNGKVFKIHSFAKMTTEEVITLGKELGLDV